MWTRGKVRGAAEEAEQTVGALGPRPQGLCPGLACAQHSTPPVGKGGGEGGARTGRPGRGAAPCGPAPAACAGPGPAPEGSRPAALPVWMRLCRSSWLGLANAFSHVSHLNTRGFWELKEGPA